MPAPSATPRQYPSMAQAHKHSLRLEMPYVTPGQLAFSSLQFLPVPILVLDSLKTVVLANEAMGRLRGSCPTRPRPEMVWYP